VIDINLIREKPDWVKEELKKRFDDSAVARVDTILDLDKQRRALLLESETLQAERNKLNRAMGRFRGNKALSKETMNGVAARIVTAIQNKQYADALELMTNPPADVTGDDMEGALERLTETLRGMGERVEVLNKELEVVDVNLKENHLWIPNLLQATVKVGAGDADNTIALTEGEPRKFDFTPKPHWELGPALDVIDFERGVKLSGTRFYILKGMGARLQRALINLCLDYHAKNGYTELYVPFIVKEENFYGAGQFPKFRNDIFADRDAELYLLPTAEVAITNLHRDEILDADQLPLNYVANTPCWRREATSAGRDVRGIKRVHQFQKVEMYKLTTPETSNEEHAKMYEQSAGIIRMLNIPFHKLELCSGDVGFGMARTFDIEMWAPGCNEWLEVSSVSNAEAFQARRAAIRYRSAAGAKPEFVHTLNGSGLAMPRVIISILENYQRADGTVEIPEVLRPYLGGQTVIEPTA
jgi:seryl-tRNA synthetase